MSPVSRGRKRPKSRQSGLRVVRPAAPEAPQVCDCPECSGAEFSPGEFIDDLIAGGADLLTTEDPLDAELFGASFVAAGNVAGDGFAEALSVGIVPAVAAQATPAALAVLLALESVHADPAITAAVQQLTTAGVPGPPWAAELREVVRVGRCQRFVDAAVGASILTCSFERAGRTRKPSATRAD